MIIKFERDQYSQINFVIFVIFTIPRQSAAWALMIAVSHKWQLIQTKCITVCGSSYDTSLSSYKIKKKKYNKDLSPANVAVLRVRAKPTRILSNLGKVLTVAGK